MKVILSVSVGAVCLTVLLIMPAQARFITKCSKDAVPVGATCVDKYEASVWETTDETIIVEIKEGKIKSAADLAGKATQRGDVSDDYDAAGCPDTGNGCTDAYAVSIPGVTPSSFITWFQAAAACRNAGKRLLTNAEWQVAALGTPDDNTCIVTGGVTGVTGTDGCLSDVGAFDMVGNLEEWVADWVPRSEPCNGSWGTFSDDFQCLSGAVTGGKPAALIRGGGHSGPGPNNGVFSVHGDFEVSVELSVFGFRCGR